MSYKSSPPPPYSVLPDTTPSSSLFDSLKRTLASCVMSPSQIEINIVPFDTVDMYGQPDGDSAYSLSGVIEISLVPPSGYLSDAPPIDQSFFLESLVVTFEGQSELVAPQTGYAACRLIKFSRELIHHAFPLSHTWGQHTSYELPRWSASFNLTIPGWLPASSSTSFGDLKREEPEISYCLSAVARYRDSQSSSQPSWRTMCYGSTGLSTLPVAKAPREVVKINRYTLPPPPCLLRDTEFPNAGFRMVEYNGTIHDTDARCCIPTKILSKLRIRASVPEHIPADAGVFPLLLKIRPEGLSADERKRLRLPGFYVSVQQNEVHRSSMSTEYAEKWPVPPDAEQPPKKPLSKCRQDTSDYGFDLLFTSPGCRAVQSFSLFPTGFSGRIEVDGDGMETTESRFADDKLEREDTWIRVRLDIPFRDVFVAERYLPQYHDHPVPKLRPSGDGPILSVAHSLDMTLTCTYDQPASGSARAEHLADELKISIPLSFVRVPRTGPCHYPDDKSFSAHCGDPLTVSTVRGPGWARLQADRVPLPAPSQPYAQSLPGYNTLYHKDGARREDPTPLPRYEPKNQHSEDLPPPSLRIVKHSLPTLS